MEQREEEEEEVLVLLGGWPEWEEEWGVETVEEEEEVKSSYSVVSPGGCRPHLPPLPRGDMWDPVAAAVGGALLVCNMDYTAYMSAARRKDYRCWALHTKAAPLAWTPFPAPPKRLFLAASTAWRGRLAVVGGSETHHTDLAALRGTRHLQLYSPARRQWSRGPALPAPLFEGCAAATRLGLLVLGEFDSGDTNLYLLARGVWRGMPASRHPHVRPGCTVTTVGQEDGLIAVSGSVVELFSLARQEWRELPRLAVARAAHARVSVGHSAGRLVVAGGWDMYTMEPATAVEVWRGEGWQVEGQVVGRTRQAEVHLPATTCLTPGIP